MDEETFKVWASGCALGLVWEVEPLDNGPWAAQSTHVTPCLIALTGVSPATLTIFFKNKKSAGLGRPALGAAVRSHSGLSINTIHAHQ